MYQIDGMIQIYSYNDFLCFLENRMQDDYSEKLQNNNDSRKVQII